MIDYVYSDELKYNFYNETITVVIDGVSDFVSLPNLDLTYKEIIANIIASSAGVDFGISMDTEFLKFYMTAGGAVLETITVSDADLAELLGFESVNNLVYDTEFFCPTWGYKLPRTTLHELASLQGGFKERSPIALYRSRIVKITAEATYSNKFITRRGFTYKFRLDWRYITWFDRLIAVWSDSNLTATTEDINVIDGACINMYSGEVEQIYETHNIFESTISILGPRSGAKSGN